MLQVVSATYSTQTSIASTTMTDTGLSLDITPSSASSKILALVTHPSTYWGRTTYDAGIGMDLQRAGTTVYDFKGTRDGAFYFTWQTLSSPLNCYMIATIAFSYLDSPATTSQITYKTRAGINATSNNGQIYMQYNNLAASMILMEIGA